jgi:hypothetical protein
MRSEGGGVGKGVKVGREEKYISGRDVAKEGGG